MDRRELAKKLIESEDGKIECAVKENLTGTTDVSDIVGVDFYSPYRPFYAANGCWWDEAEPVEEDANNMPTTKEYVEKIDKLEATVVENSKQMQKLQGSVDALNKQIDHIYNSIHNILRR